LNDQLKGGFSFASVDLNKKEGRKEKKEPRDATIQTPCWFRPLTVTGGKEKEKRFKHGARWIRI